MSQPLFILAPPRSFTSVSCAMIGCHPQMFGLAETNLFTADLYEELTRVYRMRRRLQHGLLRCIAELGLGGQTEENIETAKQWLDENLEVPTAEIFGDLVAWGEPRNLVDKSPSYVYKPEHLERILVAFPDARFLHLTRHPRGTCESIYKMRQQVHAGSAQLRKKFKRLGERMERAQNKVELTPETMWLSPHRNIVEFLEIVPEHQQLRLQGEDLLSEPARHLRDIAEWLEVSTDDEAVDAMLHPETSPFACPGPKNAKFGNDPEFLESPALRDYERKDLSLDEPLSWDDSMCFGDETIEYAREFGY